MVLRASLVNQTVVGLGGRRKLHVQCKRGCDRSVDDDSQSDVG